MQLFSHADTLKRWEVRYRHTIADLASAYQASRRGHPGWYLFLRLSKLQLSIALAIMTVDHMRLCGPNVLINVLPRMKLVHDLSEDLLTIVEPFDEMRSILARIAVRHGRRQNERLSHLIEHALMDVAPEARAGLEAAIRSVSEASRSTSTSFPSILHSPASGDYTECDEGKEGSGSV